MCVVVCVCCMFVVSTLVQRQTITTTTTTTTTTTIIYITAGQSLARATLPDQHSNQRAALDGEEVHVGVCGECRVLLKQRPIVHASVRAYACVCASVNQASTSAINRVQS